MGDNFDKAAFPKSIETVSLFAGCGGLDLGFIGGFTFLGDYYPPLDFRILKAYDIDHKSVETYRRNIGDHIKEANLTLVPVDEIPKADVVLAGFPCQDFSSCGPKRGLESHRGQLYKSVVQYMAHHKPRVVVAENVPHLQRMQKGAVLAAILSDLEEVGYRFDVWKLFAPDYGVPQTRTRLFLIGVLKELPGGPIEPPKSHLGDHRTVNWAIQDLVGVEDESVPNQSQYFRASKAKRGNGQGDEVSRSGQPAYTVRANAKSRVQFHHELPRRLTVRECARLQTFPDSFVFPHSATTNIMQIGNAVPPVLAHHVATSIAKYVMYLDDYRLLPYATSSGATAQAHLALCPNTFDA